VLPEDLTPSFLSGVFDTEIATVTSARIGDGLVGMNLRLGLSDGSGAPAGPGSVVVKLPSPDPVSRQTGINLRNYEREVRFYSELATTLDIRVPACSFAEWDAESGDFTLILEDMAPAQVGDQIAACSLDHARTAVVELARLHGPRWNDPALDDIEWLSRRSGPQDTELLQMMYRMFWPGFSATYAKYLDEAQLALAERFADAVPAWVDGREGPFTVLHGDYRLDNLLFGTDAGGPPVVAVDWQSPGHGPALADVSYFLGAGLPSDERAVYERDLVGEYFEALSGYGVEGITAESCWDQYRREAFAGVIMSVVASQIVGSTERSEQMFAAMATRHLRHALDVDAEALI
jgi:hypothetical protein